MDRHFVAALKDLENRIMMMASHVQSSIDTVAQALQTSDASQISAVYRLEEQINREQMTVDDACVKHLALQQPLASDLRLVISIIKMNSDLERMGDHAVNIAHNAEKYLAGGPLKPLEDLPGMFSEVKLMVRDSLESFFKRDVRLAEDVLLRDDIVDGLKNKIFLDVVEILKTKPQNMDSGLALIFIARNLEKIADHATNIAEDLIFVVSGKDVRHSPRGSPVQSV